MVALHLIKKEQDMPNYVDGFVIPVPKKHLKTYQAMAKKAAKTWKKYGALEYVESIGDDVPKGKITSFPRGVKLKSSETVVFAYAVYKSRKHRDQVMAKIMKDEDMMKLWENAPFDGMRMIWGGFKTIASS